MESARIHKHQIATMIKPSQHFATDRIRKKNLAERSSAERILRHYHLPIRRKKDRTSDSCATARCKLASRQSTARKATRDTAPCILCDAISTKQSPQMCYDGKVAKTPLNSTLLPSFSKRNEYSKLVHSISNVKLD